MLRAVANMVGGGFAGSFTTLTVSGQASFAAGSAAAPSVKVGADQSGLYQSAAGNLDIATAGARIARFGTVGGTGNYLDFSANNTPLVLAAGPGANISLQVSSKGAADLLLATASGVNQVRIPNTVGADRYLTLTGSNGGSPTIGTSAGDLAFSTNIGVTGYIAGSEQTAPAAPSANGYRIFAQDNGAGKTQLMVIFASGAAQQLAIEP